MIDRDGAKMSKSKGNVVAPDECVDRYGADAVRLYILFMGPADEDMEWHGRRASRASRGCSTGSGASSLEVAERAPVEEPGDGDPLARKAHRTIAKVTDDIVRRFQFHTPIAARDGAGQRDLPRRTPDEPGGPLRDRDGVSR